ncbi:MAG: glycosyltransferase [Campylobacterota bacterium]|nr:glycosyltransferase [Campylobacterota bacterium]
MKKIDIAIKNKTKLTSKLETIFDVSYYKQQSFLSKIFFKNKNYPTLYFHNGVLNSQAIDLINNSKVIIVNTNGVKESILNKLPALSKNKIHILYPYIKKSIEYDLNIKLNFRKKYNIEDNTRLIFFTASELHRSGLKEFLKIISQIQAKNFKVMIYSDTNQINQLKLLINRLKIDYQIIMIDDIKNRDILFIASDIFILPTKQKSYLSNILKALYYKNIVFVPQSNYTSEILDTFSIMNGVDDPTTAFKIDALLENSDELNQIQELNHSNTSNFDFDSRMNIIKSIINNKLDLV